MQRTVSVFSNEQHFGIIGKSWRNVTSVFIVTRRLIINEYMDVSIKYVDGVYMLTWCHYIDIVLC